MFRYFVLLIIGSALLLPLIGFAQGVHTTGNVIIEVQPSVPVYPQRKELLAQYNVRWNTAPTTYTTYVRVYGNLGSSVRFYARAGNGDTFYCYIPAGNALYEQAKRIRNSAGNGSFIRVTHMLDSSICNGLEHRRYSRFLD